MVEKCDGRTACVASQGHWMGFNNDMGSTAILYRERISVECCTMKDLIENYRVMILTAFRSWWVIGIVGWTIIYLNYPIDSVLPLYAV